MIKNRFIALSTSLVNASNHTKCVSLSTQECKIQPTLINLNTNKYSQELHYHPFAVKLDKCIESCNNLNDLCNKVCVPNKTEDLNIHVFNTITGTNESKILTTGISCKCKCRFDGKNVIQINGATTIYINVSVKSVMKKIMFRILLYVVVKMENI